MAKRVKPVGAQEFFPEEKTLSTLQEAAKSCRGCSLYERATQTVFGAGGAGARLMLVGEQPGDQAVIPRKVKIADERGKIIEEGAPPKLVTIHPSAIVRIPDREMREKAFGDFVNDLKAARAFLG